MTFVIWTFGFLSSFGFPHSSIPNRARGIPVVLDPNTILWGFIQRLAEAASAAAPTILCGLVVAGVFRRMLGPTNTRKLFGVGTWRALPQAWAVGMLLPVGSLGAIPIALEMRRVGISGGTILAFAMTAPLFNPISVVYGLTLSEPIIVLSFALGSLVVVTGIGIAWDRLVPGTSGEPPTDEPVAYGLKRLAAVVVAAARMWTGPVLGYCLVGLLGVAIVGALMPSGSLQFALNHGNARAPLTMASIALPLYSTPTVVMMQIGSMFQHGNSVGAAFVLLVIGAGVNLGTALWTWRSYGLRATLTWLALLFVIVLTIAFAIEHPLYLDGQDEQDHTHAFDRYTSPFHEGATDMASQVAFRLRENTALDGKFGLLALALLLGLGAAARLVDRKWPIDEFFTRGAEESFHATSLGGRPLPPSVIGGTALVGLVAFSIFACYIVYPEPSETCEDMRIISTVTVTAAMTGDWETAERHLKIWEDLSRKLEVGVYLREFALSPERKRATENLRVQLDLLHHVIEDQDRDEARQLLSVLSQAGSDCRSSYVAAASGHLGGAD